MMRTISVPLVFLIISVSVITYIIHQLSDSYSWWKLPNSTINGNRYFASEKHVSCITQQKVQHFVMTKVAKAGSSTLFSILGRFAVNNKLNVLSPISTVYINWDFSKRKGWNIGPGLVKRADVLINHALYDEAMLDKYIVKDYKWIVPIREPVSWFKSIVKYSEHHIGETSKSYSAEEVIWDEDLFRLIRVGGTGKTAYFHLRQLQWLGFDYRQHHNMTAIEEHISYIMQRIDVPVLNEYFDASLVMLRRRFCWDYTDIFYSSYTITNSSEREPLTESAVEKLLSPEYNLGDKLLYEAVNKSWWQQPEVRDASFWEEVSYFSQINRLVSTEWCPEVIKTMRPHHIPPTQFHNTLTLTHKLCKELNSAKKSMMECMRTYAMDPIKYSKMDC